MIKSVFVIFALLITAQGARALDWPADMPRIPQFEVDPLRSQRGYRFGIIPTIESTYGWKQEGEMLMGYGSGDAAIYDDLCLKEGMGSVTRIKDVQRRLARKEELQANCKIDENPWPFTMVDKDLYNEFNGRPGEPSPYKENAVLAYFERESNAILAPFVIGTLSAWIADTNRYVMKLWPADPNLNVPRFYSATGGESTVPEDLNPALGYTQGTVVKATLDHVFRKTYEITVQLGFANNKFRRFSVDDSKMFDHIVMSMRMGSQLKIGYVQLFDLEGAFRSLRGYTTYYRIASIERLSNENSGRTSPARRGRPQY